MLSRRWYQFAGRLIEAAQRGPQSHRPNAAARRPRAGQPPVVVDSADSVQQGSVWQTNVRNAGRLLRQLVKLAWDGNPPARSPTRHRRKHAGSKHLAE